MIPRVDETCLVLEAEQLAIKSGKSSIVGAQGTLFARGIPMLSMVTMVAVMVRLGVKKRVGDFVGRVLRWVGSHPSQMGADSQLNHQSSGSCPPSVVQELLRASISPGLGNRR